MPFRIERAQSPGMPPLVLARDPDGELLWKTRADTAALFEGDEAEAFVARHNLHDVDIRGVRNTVESEHVHQES
jgi:hypothetical protein